MDFLFPRFLARRHLPFVSRRQKRVRMVAKIVTLPFRLYWRHLVAAAVGVVFAFCEARAEFANPDGQNNGDDLRALRVATVGTGAEPDGVVPVVPTALDGSSSMHGEMRAQTTLLHNMACVLLFVAGMVGAYITMQRVRMFVAVLLLACVSNAADIEQPTTGVDINSNGAPDKGEGSVAGGPLVLWNFYVGQLGVLPASRTITIAIQQEPHGGVNPTIPNLHQLTTDANGMLTGVKKFTTGIDGSWPLWYTGDPLNPSAASDPARHENAHSPWFQFRIRYSVSGVGGWTSPFVIYDRSRRKHVNTGNMGGTRTPTTYVSRVIMIKPQDFVEGIWNVDFAGVGRTDMTVRWLFKWDGDSEAAAQMCSALPGNPPGMAAMYLTKTEPVVPDPPPSKGFTLWRSVGGGGWQVYVQDSVPFGQTVVIRDQTFDNQAAPADEGTTPPTVENPPPDSAQTTTPSGSPSGSVTPTTPGNSGGGTGGGEGDELTQAEVQQAVRDGVKQAANDSTVPVAPADIELPTEQSKTDQEAQGIKDKLSETAVQRQAVLDSLTTKFNDWRAIWEAMPHSFGTVSTLSYGNLQFGASSASVEINLSSALGGIVPKLRLVFLWAITIIWALKSVQATRGYL